METKDKVFLQKIYGATDWLQGKWRCREGCSACCTQSVTMSSLEGEYIADFLQARQIGLPPFLRCGAAAKKPDRTTNQFVRQFIEQSSSPETEDQWAYGPCPFLENGRCTIYPVRPYMCRGFVSTVDCRGVGYAETPPEVITFNTIVLQVLEHASQGGPWGLLAYVLEEVCADAAEAHDRKTLICQEVPGVIVHPEELATLNRPFAWLKGVVRQYYYGPAKKKLLDLFVD